MPMNLQEVKLLIKHHQSQKLLLNFAIKFVNNNFYNFNKWNFEVTMATFCFSPGVTCHPWKGNQNWWFTCEAKEHYRFKKNYFTWILNYENLNNKLYPKLFRKLTPCHLTIHTYIEFLFAKLHIVFSQEQSKFKQGVLKNIKLHATEKSFCRTIIIVITIITFLDRMSISIVKMGSL